MALALPPSKRCAVCITFDFDCISLWLGMIKSFNAHGIGRGEFGARVGAERLLALFDEYDVPTSWFTPGHTAETWPAVVRAVAAAGHEIAHHGYCHESPVEMAEREEAILVQGIEAIESVVGTRPIGYRAPTWHTTDNTVPLLMKHGFTYASNGMAEDFRPFRARVGDVASLTQRFTFGEEVDLIEIPSAWHLTDAPMLEAGPPNHLSPSPSEAERIWRDEFDYMREHVDGGVITYVFHPETMARGHRIMILERLLAHMRGCGDVWFARTDEIAAAWQPDPPGLWAER